MSHYKILPVGNRDVTHVLITGSTVELRPLGNGFDGSTSLFENEDVLCTSIGQAIWLTLYTPVRHDHLRFVQALLQAFWGL